MFEPLLCYIEANKTENLFIQDEKSTGGDHSVFFYVNLFPVFIFLGLMNHNMSEGTNRQNTSEYWS